jgi:superfamily II DNA helicase RecQ
MEPLNSLFELLPEHRIGVCKAHHQGMTLSQLPSHLHSSHQNLTVATRKAIVLAAAAFPQWAKSPDEVVYPPLQSNLVAHLPVYKNGLKCTAEAQERGLCRYIVRTLRDMQEHAREKHRWANPRKRGRPYQANQAAGCQLWAQGVWCQKFQPTGPLARLFEVRQPHDKGKQSAAEEEGELQRAIEMAFTQSTMAIELARQEAHAQIEPDDNRYLWHDWLRRTQWARHLARLDRPWLLQQVQRPAESEEALAKVCWAVEMVIWKAQRASSPDVVGLPATTFIERREAGAPSNEKPFNALQTGKTMMKYSGYWVSIVCYLWRTHELPDAEAVAEDADCGIEAESKLTTRHVSGRKPRYCLSAGQIRALWLIEETLLAAQRDKVNNLNDDSSSSEYDASHDKDDGESERNEGREEELERHVLTLLIALLDHQLGDHYYKSALVSATAVLGVDRNCGWKPPHSYTTLLSGIVTVAKMLVLYSAVQTRKQEVAELERTGGWPREDAEAIATKHVELVQQSVKGFMTLTDYGGKPTPMDWVLRLRAYGKGANKGTNSAGHVLWVGDEILYGYVRYSMSQLRSMIHGLVEATRMEVRRELLLLEVDDAGDAVEGATPLPTVDWNTMVDNPAELRSGWNFLQDTRNTFSGVDGAGWLAKRVANEKKLRSVFVDADASRLSAAAEDGVAWVKKRVEQYEKAMRLFREHLLVAMHMTGGQPARGTELVTTTYLNQPNGQSRGIFVEDGLMVYVTLYHKGIGQTRQAKVVHRYLPQEVGELLFYYLWMVLPFWQRLERASRGIQSEPSPFIWEPMKEEAWTGPRRKKQQQSPKEAEDSGESEDEHGTQVNLQETPKLAAAAGRTEQWGTNQVRRAIERASLHRLETKLNLQIWRHNTVAIIQRYVKDRDVLKTLGYGDDETDEVENDPFDLQSTHTTKTVGQVYGRPATESPWSVQSQRGQFRQVSLAWHHFLQFSSALSTPPNKSSTAAAAQEEAKEEQYRRWKQMRETNIQTSLEQLQGTGAQFRGCQRPVLEAVMQQKSPVVVIMGTGTGKSLVFMLPALTSTGVTVLVVPLLALKTNLKDRCVKAGIECVEWDSNYPHEWAQIVLVVPEVAVSAPFKSFLNRQRAMGRLDRVVIDECHIVLESTKGWRTQVLKLRNLVQAETQLVYLTATLKPKEEGEFIRLMALPPKEDSHWFRSPTTRPNIAYRVHWYNETEEEETDVVARLVQEAKEQYPLPGQIIVYCDSVAKTKQYAARLGAVCFHREAGTVGEKLALLRLLTDGQQQVFVATSALGLGVDRSSVRHVFFIGQIRRLRDLVQQSGRAGRDGAPSKATIIRGAVYAPNGKRRVGSRFGDIEAEVHEIIQGDGCIRVVIDREMDGHERLMCKRGEEVCSRCREKQVLEEEKERVDGRDKIVEAGKKGAARQEFERSLVARRNLARQEMTLQSREQLEVERLREMLQEWEDGCQWCRVNELAGAKHHQLADCTQEQADDVREGVREMMKRVRWEKYSCCFKCGVPQSMCASYRERPDAGWDKISGAQCQFAGVLIASVISIWVAADSLFGDWVRAQMEKEGIEQGEEELYFDRVLAWMAALVQWGGIQSNKMCWVFVRFVTLFTA